jgi:hypothetical protein
MTLPRPACADARGRVRTTSAGFEGRFPSFYLSSDRDWATGETKTTLRGEKIEPWLCEATYPGREEFQGRGRRAEAGLNAILQF